MPKELVFAFARWIEVRETVIMVVEAMYTETTEVVKVDGETSGQFYLHWKRDSGRKVGKSVITYRGSKGRKKL